MKGKDEESFLRFRSRIKGTVLTYLSACHWPG